MPSKRITLYWNTIQIAKTMLYITDLVHACPTEGGWLLLSGNGDTISEIMHSGVANSAKSRSTVVIVCSPNPGESNGSALVRILKEHGFDVFEHNARGTEHDIVV